jgi:hypothetical protein
VFPSFRVVCPSLFSPLHHGVKLMNLSRASTEQIKTHYTSFIPCIDVNVLAKGSFVRCIFWMTTWTMCMMDIGIQCGYTFQRQGTLANPPICLCCAITRRSSLTSFFSRE